MLKTNPKEVDALYNDILIQVTGFFRDPAVFEGLKTKVFPQFLKNRSSQDSIRIWVPGCATGEEVYSMAICLLECMGSKGATPLQLFATDISETALQRARAGVYPEQALSHVDAKRRRRFFVPVAGGYQIAKSIKDLCVFAKQNVVNDPPFSKLDLISCRNVMIYLGPLLQKKVTAIFHYALKPGGLLLLGNSETLSLFPDLFNTIDTKLKVYSKKLISVPQHPHFSATNYSIEKQDSSEFKSSGEGSLLNLRKAADHYVLEKRAPAGVIIDSDMTIVEFRGPINHYLELVPGEAKFNLLKLAKDGLLPELRPAIEKAKKGDVPVRTEGSRIKRESHFTDVAIEVVPLKQPTSPEPHFLVLFEDVIPKALIHANALKKGRGKPSSTALAAADLEISRLKRELIATKDYLQSINNEQETVNEELQSAHEEALSSNEEYQSTNEELETAKEELQATIEETATLNEELQNRNLELNRLNDDLTNIMDRASSPIVILGKDLRIRRLTLAAGKMLNLTQAETGRSVHELKLAISMPDLEPLIAGVLATLVAQEREIQDAHGHWYRMLVEAYKTSDDAIDGVVLSFSDIQGAKERQASATAWATELEERVKERTDQLTQAQDALHQSEKLEALGRLAGGVAHDFNNLMTGILGITEDLQQQLGPTNAYKTDLDDVINAARKATALTKQLLAFGRRQTLAPKILNLNDVITSMQGLFRRLLGEDVELKMLLDPHVGNVKLDQGQVEQMIVNLGLNARDAMLTGGTLTLETRNVDIHSDDRKRLFDAPSGPYLMLSISDTGCGMSKDTLTHMFEPFFTTKEAGKGTGLGLANVYGSVKQAGGDIAVESQPEHGTTFRLYFPRVDDTSDSERRNLDRRDVLGGSERFSS